MKIFRFDDICLNADMKTANSMARFLKEKFEGCEVLFCVSPLVHDMSDEEGKHRQRIFPKILNAHSDHRVFYNVDRCGVPEITEDVTLAGHGLIHVDHRLLSKEAQEMSILTSCSLVKARIFVPPFNKWNSDTEDICKEHQIKLVKFETGWKCMEYNDYDPKQRLWYLHHREFTLEEFKGWFK
jgi:hypothetical protein